MDSCLSYLPPFPLLPNSPLQISRLLLSLLGTDSRVYHQNRIPSRGPVLVVSNHRSFMDAPVLMAALGQSIHFACHHYMGQVPIMRDVVTQLGCFPLDAPGDRQQRFFNQATRLLQNQQVVGIFPEGAQPMVSQTHAEQVGNFQRGFAHLALRASVEDLAVLPVAIASHEEVNTPGFPLRLLSMFDPSEPLFDQDDWHPMIVYKRVHVMIGRPRFISATERQHYHGKQARATVNDLTQYCNAEVETLLRRGYY